MLPGGNSMSTTAPVTRATRPVAPAAGAAGAWLSMVVVMCVLSMSCRRGAPSANVSSASVSAFGAAGSRERIGTADDLRDLLGDLRLAGGVRQPGELVDLRLRVVGGGLHRTLGGRVLGGHRLQQDVDDPRLDVARHELLDDRVGVGRELVQRVRRARRLVPG